MTFVLKATFEQTYMFYTGANFARRFSFVFTFEKKKKKKKGRKETLTKVCALTKLLYTTPFFNHGFIFTPVQKPHEPVIEISKSVRVHIGSFEKGSSQSSTELKNS